jgi:hypothetical protein
MWISEMRIFGDQNKQCDGRKTNENFNIGSG